MFVNFRVGHWLPARCLGRAAARLRQLCPSGKAPDDTRAPPDSLGAPPSYRHREAMRTPEKIAGSKAFCVGERLGNTLQKKTLAGLVLEARRRCIANAETREYDFRSFGMPIDNKVGGRTSLDAYSYDHVYHARAVVHG